MHCLSTDILFLDNNSLTGSMEPICDVASNVEFLSADTTVSGCNNCCSEYCEGGDDSCNRPTTLEKFDYNAISREAFSFSENFRLENDSPEN